jgi:hypothetical protein
VEVGGGVEYKNDSVNSLLLSKIVTLTFCAKVVEIFRELQTPCDHPGWQC